MNVLYIGIDVGGTTAKAGVVDEARTYRILLLRH